MGMRERFLAAYRTALEAVDPERAVRVAAAGIEGPVWVAALGKAAPAMARGACSALGERVVAGVAVSTHPAPVPRPIELLIGSHPLPGPASVTAGRALLDLARTVPPEGHLLVLVSGGGSAVAEVPPTGVPVERLATVTGRLLEAGAPITEINLVRRHLSNLKNGGLLRATWAGEVTTLILSDVVDGPPSTVASGPTLPDETSLGDALATLDRYNLRPLLDIETVTIGPFPLHPPPAHTWKVVAGIEEALAAAATALGATPHRRRLLGTARVEAGRVLDACPPGQTLVVGGETTVVVTGPGSGGRNQEAALAAASEIDGTTTVFAALATDGIDGPTTAAGAIVDGGSVVRMRTAGVEPQPALAANDSHTALAASGDLVVTGPTGTNVGDLWMVSKPQP
jgi:hydroxypyruvate reductase